MQINIQQSKFTVRSKYSVLINGQRCFIAVSKLFRFRAEINIEASQASEASFNIKRHLSFMGPNYSIQLGEKLPVFFEADSFLKLQYECIYEKDTYTIYGHTKRRYSIFKNGTQVAAWRHELVTWFDGDNYTIEADDDCCKELIIAFCLIIEDYHSNKKGGLLRLNVFQMARKTKEENELWTSKRI